MKTKKTLALLLALALLGTFLAGCGAARTEVPEPEATAEPEVTAEPAAEPEIDYEAAYQAAMDKLRETAGAYDPDTVVCTIDGVDVTWKLYYYLLNDEIQTILYYTGALPEDFSQPVTDDLSMEDYVRDMALTKAVYYVEAAVRSEEAGLTFGEEDRAELDEYWQEMTDSYGGEEALAEEMAYSGLDRELFYYLLTNTRQLTALMQDMYGAQGENMDREDVIAWGEKNGYIRTKHVLYFFYDENGQPLDEDGKAAQKERADRTMEELRALEGDHEALEARFDEIMAADTGDAGGLSRFPDGYTFVSGTMYPVFEEAAFALEEYGLSDPVESQSGYHIILRLPLDPAALTMDQDANTGEYLTLGADAANDLFAKQMAEWITGAEVEWSEGFEDLDLNALFGTGTGEEG